MISIEEPQIVGHLSSETYDWKFTLKSICDTQDIIKFNDGEKPLQAYENRPGCTICAQLIGAGDYVRYDIANAHLRDPELILIDIAKLTLNTEFCGPLQYTVTAKDLSLSNMAHITFDSNLSNINVAKSDLPPSVFERTINVDLQINHGVFSSNSGTLSF